MAKPMARGERAVVSVTYELQAGYEYNNSTGAFRPIPLSGSPEIVSIHTVYPQSGINAVTLPLPALDTKKGAGPSNLEVLDAYKANLENIGHAIKLAEYLYHQLKVDYDPVTGECKHPT